ncbi:hypothetical protein [Streptomyces sp. NPDC057702]|uniref:hypothetical protein n=1 Tax=unclassified Streptomyces TaxID=2593676 RepID=UPI0036C93FB7
MPPAAASDAGPAALARPHVEEGPVDGRQTYAGLGARLAHPRPPHPTRCFEAAPDT